eukprot:TRINITY_DN3146_c1_g1_i1.p1 TRINITY_DN3146_c1_g1~~TRINITY_DN3146_c1_g1_i1.p1  ORF type:complete len:100 (+),score=19.91 TRINITY_DN3146_c1_g1_i1:22-300(+)
MANPRSPAEIANCLRQLSDSLPPGFPPKMKEVLLFNQEKKLGLKPERWCTACDKKFNVAAADEYSDDKVTRARFNSGLCSESCVISVSGHEG